MTQIEILLLSNLADALRTEASEANMTAMRERKIADAAQSNAVEKSDADIIGNLTGHWYSVGSAESRHLAKSNAADRILAIVEAVRKDGGGKTNG